MSQIINVMVDLETTGVSPSAGILSIGAHTFHCNKSSIAFYSKVSVESNREEGREFDSATLAWWDKQSKEARDEAFSGTTPISLALSYFNSWLETLGSPSEIFVWGNGADLDNVIMIDAYKKLDIKPSWGTWNNRCYRTLKNLFPDISAGPFDGIKHSALADAIFQARHAERILTYIGKDS